MLHKKYFQSSALARLLMILNASGPGSRLPPPNPPGIVAINNSPVPQAPVPNGSNNISPIPENRVPSRSGFVPDAALGTTSQPEVVPEPTLDPALEEWIKLIWNNATLTQPESDPLRAVTRSANTFSPDFFRLIGELIGGNVVCSAVSAWMVLAMATYGARGDTEQQMRAALALPEDNAVAMRGFQTLIDKFENYRIAEVRLANKIFINEAIPPKAEFREMTSTGFRSEVQNVNFGNPNEATRTINQWCEDQTNNRIKDLFKPGDLDPNTAMVLVNAVYFKGQWETRFDANKTVLSPFRVSPTETVDVPMMYSNGDYRMGFLDDVNARFVEIPYQSAGDNDALSMFIVMPMNVDGLPELERNMDRLTIERLSDGESGPSILLLPKFKIESELPDDLLETVLETMSMGGMYDDSADFTGIIDSPPISVNKVVQKAFIEVNEEGTEAAAATGSEFSFRFGPAQFNVNRPFLGFIGTPRQNNSVILFSFRYTGPPST